MDGTVLVADDDRTIRTVLTQALTRAGCRVHATSSLTTLMRWVAEGKGDTIITDVMMPDGNGLEMLPKIASDRPGLPVIVISAQNTIMTAIQAADAKAFDYLPKPFDLPDLMKRVAKALEQKKVSLSSKDLTEDKLNYFTNVDASKIATISHLVSTITGFNVQPNKAIVGKNAFAHESGIHQDGMLKNANTYEIITPESVGFSSSELILGKHSGRHAFKVKLNDLGFEFI